MARAGRCPHPGARRSWRAGMSPSPMPPPAPPWNRDRKGSGSCASDPAPRQPHPTTGEVRSAPDGSPSPLPPLPPLRERGCVLRPRCVRWVLRFELRVSSCEARDGRRRGMGGGWTWMERSAKGCVAACDFRFPICAIRGESWPPAPTPTRVRASPDHEGGDTCFSPAIASHARDLPGARSDSPEGRLRGCASTSCPSLTVGARMSRGECDPLPCRSRFNCGEGVRRHSSFLVNPGHIDPAVREVRSDSRPWGVHSPLDG